MSISTDILKAEHIGIRELKQHLCKVNLEKPLVITDRGRPISVNLPYEDILELVDIFDELTDAQTLSIIAEARTAIKAGAKGIPVSNLFRRLRHR